MSETDAILEAEESIQRMAAELRRMREAAVLLREAQERGTAAVEAAERVIEATANFTTACGALLEKLGRADTESQLRPALEKLDRLGHTISRGWQELANHLAGVEKATSDRLELVDTRLRGVAQGVGERSDRLESGLGALASDVKEMRAESLATLRSFENRLEGVEKRQIQEIREAKTRWIVSSVLLGAILMATLISVLLSSLPMP